MGRIRTARLLGMTHSVQLTETFHCLCISLVLCMICTLSGPLHAGDLSGFNHPVPGDIVVNEIMIDPGVVADADGEYIELYNRSTAGIDLNGWQIRDAGVDEHTIDNGGPLVIDSGTFLVLGRNANTDENGGVEVDYEYSGFVLSNSMDEIVLVDSEGTTIDSMMYSSDLGFQLEVGCSIELRNYYWDNTMAITWSAASQPFGMGDLGSPGVANSAYEEFKWVAIDARPDSQLVSPGDSMIVDIDLFNPGWLDWTCDVGSFLVLPDGSPFEGNPLDGPFSFTIRAQRVRHVRKAYVIPEAAFSGVYQLYYGVRNSDGDVFDYEQVQFEVSTLRAR